MFEKIEELSLLVRKNYELAQAAFSYTLSVIEGSSNQLTKEEIATDTNNIIKRMNLMREEPINNEEYTLEWISEIADLTLKYNVGNCCEKSCTVFDYLCKSPEFSANLELFNNPFFDHFFVVIGRDPDTDPFDPRTWNLDTIICDPWVEVRGYFIGEVDFHSLEDNKREVINYLLSHVGSTGPLILAKDILGKANGDQKSIIVQQSCMVLRTSLYKEQLTTYNHHVPAVYELWDLPKEKHYKRHLARQHFFATEKLTVSSYEEASKDDLKAMSLKSV